MADVNKAFKDGTVSGAHMMFACIVLSIKDSLGVDNDTVHELWKRSEKLMVALAERRVTIKDLDTTLKEEYDCEWKLG